MPSYPEVSPGFGMPLEDAMTTQRAVRRLRPDPVDDETLLHVLRLATKAPTGGNMQGWEFIAVRDRKSTRLNSSHIPFSRMPSSA